MLRSEIMHAEFPKGRLPGEAELMVAYAVPRAVVREALAMLRAEGMEQVWRRHARLANSTREAVLALGLKLFAEVPCNVLTAIEMPAGINSDQVVKQLFTDYGVRVAGGQDQLKGRVLRLSHTGFIDEFDIITVVAALEKALRHAGWRAPAGAGIQAAFHQFIN
jgi:aspartate aminotransferase-like enzyme